MTLKRSQIDKKPLILQTPRFLWLFFYYVYETPNRELSFVLCGRLAKQLVYEMEDIHWTELKSFSLWVGAKHPIVGFMETPICHPDASPVRPYLNLLMKVLICRSLIYTCYLICLMDEPKKSP